MGVDIKQVEGQETKALVELSKEEMAAVFAALQVAYFMLDDGSEQAQRTMSAWQKLHVSVFGVGFDLPSAETEFARAVLMALKADADQ